MCETNVRISKRVYKLLEVKCDCCSFLIRHRVRLNPFCEIIGDNKNVSIFTF